MTRVERVDPRQRLEGQRFGDRERKAPRKHGVTVKGREVRERQVVVREHARLKRGELLGRDRERSQDRRHVARDLRVRRIARDDRKLVPCEHERRVHRRQSRVEEEAGVERVVAGDVDRSPERDSLLDREPELGVQAPDVGELHEQRLVQPEVHVAHAAAERGDRLVEVGRAPSEPPPEAHEAVRTVDDVRIEVGEHEPREVARRHVGRVGGFDPHDRTRVDVARLEELDEVLVLETRPPHELPDPPERVQPVERGRDGRVGMRGIEVLDLVPDLLESPQLPGPHLGRLDAGGNGSDEPGRRGIGRAFHDGHDVALACLREGRPRPALDDVEAVLRRVGLVLDEDDVAVRGGDAVDRRRAAPRGEIAGRRDPRAQPSRHELLLHARQAEVLARDPEVLQRGGPVEPRELGHQLVPLHAEVAEVGPRLLPPEVERQDPRVERCAQSRIRRGVHVLRARAQLLRALAGLVGEGEDARRPAALLEDRIEGRMIGDEPALAGLHDDDHGRRGERDPVPGEGGPERL